MVVFSTSHRKVYCSLLNFSGWFTCVQGPWWHFPELAILRNWKYRHKWLVQLVFMHSCPHSFGKPICIYSSEWEPHLLLSSFSCFYFHLLKCISHVHSSFLCHALKAARHEKTFWAMINYVFGYYQFWQNSGQSSWIARLSLTQLEVDVVKDEVSVCGVQAAAQWRKRNYS